jgi:hypothetical protein
MPDGIGLAIQAGEGENGAFAPDVGQGDFLGWII